MVKKASLPLAARRAATSFSTRSLASPLWANWKGSTQYGVHPSGNARWLPSVDIYEKMMGMWLSADMLGSKS
jgi:hypothetical protein